MESFRKTQVEMSSQIKTREFEFSYEILSISWELKNKLELPETVGVSSFSCHIGVWLQLCNFIKLYMYEVCFFKKNVYDTFHTFKIHLFLDCPQVSVQE